MDSCRMAQSISLAEEDTEINPVPPGAGGGTQEPESDRLSNIITEFGKTWGGKFSDREPVGEVISRIPEQVLEDQKYQDLLGPAERPGRAGLRPPEAGHPDGEAPDGTLQGENCETPEGGFEVINAY